MRTFNINGVTYTAKKIGFNTICELDERGLSIDKIGERPMLFMRTYFAMCCGKDDDFAGEQLEEHVINGGDFNDLMDVVQAEMEESGFFQALKKAEKKNTPATKKSNKSAQA